MEVMDWGDWDLGKGSLDCFETSRGPITGRWTTVWDSIYCWVLYTQERKKQTKESEVARKLFHIGSQGGLYQS